MQVHNIMMIVSKCIIIYGESFFGVCPRDSVIIHNSQA